MSRAVSLARLTERAVLGHRGCLLLCGQLIPRRHFAASGEQHEIFHDELLLRCGRRFITDTILTRTTIQNRQEPPRFMAAAFLLDQRCLARMVEGPSVCDVEDDLTGTLARVIKPNCSMPTASSRTTTESATTANSGTSSRRHGAASSTRRTGLDPEVAVKALGS